MLHQPSSFCSQIPVYRTCRNYQWSLGIYGTVQQFVSIITTRDSDFRTYLIPYLQRTTVPYPASPVEPLATCDLIYFTSSDFKFTDTSGRTDGYNTDSKYAGWMDGYQV